MSCNPSTGSECCQIPQLVVDEVCESFNLVNSSSVTIWSESNPLTIYSYIVTILVDPASTLNVSVNIATNSVPPGGGHVSIIPGVFYGDLVLTTTGTGFASGKVCIKILRMFV